MPFSFFANKRNILVFFLSLVIVVFPAVAFAKGLVPCGDAGEPECVFCHFFALIQNIIDFFVLTLVPPVATIMVVVGRLGYIVGAHTGNEKTGNWGRGVLISVFWGLVIVYAAWVVINTLLLFFVDQSVFPLPWNEIVCKL